MSLDWSLKNLNDDFDYRLNITSNLVSMQEKAGVYEALRAEGTQAKEHIETLKKGIDHFNIYREEYEALNPENGWGSADSFIKFLHQALALSERYPESIISACY